jgi:hypothetical protein
MHTKCWSENLKGQDHSEDQGMRIREDNIRMDHKEIWWKGSDWMDLAQDKTSGGLL